VAFTARSGEESPNIQGAEERRRRDRAACASRTGSRLGGGGAGGAEDGQGNVLAAHGDEGEGRESRRIWMLGKNELEMLPAAYIRRGTASSGGGGS
jgi:hypothetical protein